MTTSDADTGASRSLPPPSLAESLPELARHLAVLDGQAPGRSLLPSLDSWHAWLLLFGREIDLPAGEWTHKTQHRYDWVGLLCTRSIVQRRLDALGGSVPLEVTQWLQDVDSYMRSLTERLPDWWQEADLAPEPSHWWWQHLPTHGPVRAGWWADDPS